MTINSGEVVAFGVASLASKVVIEKESFPRATGKSGTIKMMATRFRNNKSILYDIL